MASWWRRGRKRVLPDRPTAEEEHRFHSAEAFIHGSPQPTTTIWTVNRSITAQMVSPKKEKSRN